MKDINEYYARCRKMLEDIGVPVGNVVELRVSTLRSSTSQCVIYPDTYECMIRMDRRMLNNKTNESDVIDTMLHELIHTIPGCLEHKGMWAEYARQTDEYYGTHVLSCYDRFVFEHPEMPVVAVFRCTDCGADFYVRDERMITAVLNGTKRCDYCKGAYDKENKMARD